MYRGRVTGISIEIRPWEKNKELVVVRSLITFAGGNSFGVNDVVPGEDFDLSNAAGKVGRHVLNLLAAQTMLDDSGVTYARP